MVRPDITRFEAAHRFHQGSRRARRSAIDEHSAWHVWCEGGCPLDGAEIERMHSVSLAELSRDRDGPRFTARALEFDVDGGTTTDGGQHVLESWDVGPSGQRKARELRPHSLRNGMGPHGRIVVYHNDTVRGGVNVQLDGVRATFERELERRKSVFAALTRGAAVGHPFGGNGDIWHVRLLFRNLTDSKRLTTRRRQRLPYGRMTDPGRTSGDPRDSELIAAWKAGNQRAATELVERHASALARFAVSCGVRDDVDELVQDTFVRAFASLDGFRGESGFRTWLFSIERRLLLDRRRAERRRPAANELTEDAAATEYGGLDRVVAGETRDQVWEAIGRLTPTQREVFVLRVTEGLSYKEIADAVGTTEGAARVHYHNAMRAVKEQLDG